MGGVLRAGLCALVCALAVVGCGDDDGVSVGAGDGGTGGTGGSAGTAGTGGDSGAAGTAGSSGAAGTGSGTRETCSGSGDCDDGLYCNGRERCIDGACVPGDAVVCDDGVGCTSDRCSEIERSCLFTVPDVDGDGHGDASCVDGENEPLGDDCDDNDANRYPGNVEVCDPAGHDEDCDPTTTGERDRDGDGFTDAACCNRVGDTLTCGTDCDDLRPAVNPAGTETCNERDDDCDGEIDEETKVTMFEDRDRDLHGAPGTAQLACPGAQGFSNVDDDCDDENPAIHGAQPEICDGIDNDCDILIDENPGVATWYRDLDGDGFGSPESGTVVSCAPVPGYVLLGSDCDDRLSGVNPAAEEQCNGRDDDCNGLADYRIGPGDLEDDDGDGFPDAACTRGNDCDDRSAAVYPGAPEVCDGLDNDCDGVADNMSQDTLWYPDDDGDGFGDSSRPAVRACVPPRFYVIRGGDCDDSNAAINPGSPDLCDGKDEDCDDRIDEDAPQLAFYTDLDGDGFGGDPPTFACARPFGMIVTGGDCDDTRSSSAPGADELCNGRDDDCDGLTDEDFAVRSCGFGICERVVAECGVTGDLQVCIPGQPEVADRDLCNNLDDDCDGKVDESASIHCSNQGTLGTCNAGVCEILACNAGYEDCNDFHPDGCEVNLLTSAAHCGECGNACAFGDTCAGGRCQNAPSSIAAGIGHTCVVIGSGDVYCWGLNSLGQSGSPTTSGVLLSATQVDGLEPALEVSSTSNHTCALLGDRTAACWGDGTYRQLGAGTAGSSSVPVSIVGVGSALEIVAGHAFTCWRDAGQIVRCFGARCGNRLGHTSSTNCSDTVAAPGAAVAGLPASSAIALGYAHAFARISSGNTELRSWGNNTFGQIANGGTSTATGGVALTTMTVTGGAAITDAIDLAAGRNFSCAARRTGEVVCNGQDSWGQIGNDATLSNAVRAVPVAGIEDAVRVWAGHDHACAKHADGTLSCWGRNDAGQLLVDTDAASQPTPIAVSGLPGEVMEMAMGEQHTCAIMSTKRVACWGDNSQGQLGDGTGVARSSFVLVSGLP